MMFFLILMQKLERKHFFPVRNLHSEAGSTVNQRSLHRPSLEDTLCPEAPVQGMYRIVVFYEFTTFLTPICFNKL